MGSKTYITSKGDFLKNRAPAIAGARLLRFWGSKLGAKIDQKSNKKRVQHRKPSEHRIFIDVNGFWDPSWGPRSTQDGAKSIQDGIKKRSYFWSRLRGPLRLSWLRQERPRGVRPRPAWERKERILCEAWRRKRNGMEKTKA